MQKRYVEMMNDVTGAHTNSVEEYWSCVKLEEADETTCDRGETPIDQPRPRHPVLRHLYFTDWIGWFARE